MWPSLKPSQRVAVAAAIDPQSGEAPIYSPWVPVSSFAAFLGIIQAGALGAGGTVDAQIQQAQDGVGTGVKPVPGAAIVTLTQAAVNDSSTQSEINCRSDQLDINNGFNFVRLAIMPEVANSLVAGLLLGVDQLQGAASDNDAASVLQIVN